MQCGMKIDINMKILSISDVITNSSSEVFIIHAKPEFQEEINEKIPEFLRQLCAVFDINADDIMEFETSCTTRVDTDWFYYTVKGDLEIYSTEDNSIPGYIMEIIEEIPFIKKFRNMFSGYFAKDIGEKEMPYFDWNSDETIKTKKREIESIQRIHLG